jgi:hypothetical protein
MTRRDLASESRRLQDALCGFPGVREITADTKATRRLLLDTDGQMTVLGRLWRIEAKSIGAGVYRLRLAEKS